MLENVRSMYNVGSVFRTSDAFLISEVILGGITGRPPHVEITKTALGAEESVSWHYVEDSLKEVERYKGEGWKICVLEQAHDSIKLEEFEPVKGEKYLVIAGNEVDGVDQRIVDRGDYILEIGQYGVKHSLNVSVSVGICLWHIMEKMKKWDKDSIK
ncbi:MAG: TrmH family RNA methyltransferase [Muribaculaceae bacterium]|nr:TrmH family RNA methyltransferase [Muribaculaceae bacterium]